MSETTTTHPTGPRPIGRLRQRMLDELAIREFGDKCWEGVEMSVPQQSRNVSG